MNKIRQFGSSSSLSQSTLSSTTPRNNNNQSTKDVNVLAKKFWIKIKQKAQTASKVTTNYITVSDERQSERQSENRLRGMNVMSPKPVIPVKK